MIRHVITNKRHLMMIDNENRVWGTGSSDSGILLTNHIEC